MGCSQAQGLPRVALADELACSASPRGIHAMNEASASDAPAHSLPPAQAPRPGTSLAGSWVPAGSGAAGHPAPGNTRCPGSLSPAAGTERVVQSLL